MPVARLGQRRPPASGPLTDDLRCTADVAFLGPPGHGESGLPRRATVGYCVLRTTAGRSARGTVTAASDRGPITRMRVCVDQ